MRDKRAKYGVCKANFVLAQKETKNVSHITTKKIAFNGGYLAKVNITLVID